MDVLTVNLARDVLSLQLTNGVGTSITIDWSFALLVGVGVVLSYISSKGTITCVDESIWTNGVSSMRVKG